MLMRSGSVLDTSMFALLSADETILLSSIAAESALSASRLMETRSIGYEPRSLGLKVLWFASSLAEDLPSILSRTESICMLAAGLRIDVNNEEGFIIAAYGF